MVISNEAFKKLIEARSEHSAEAAAADRQAISAGNSNVVVRKQGGYILKAVLTTPEGKAAPVLYADADTSPHKINATHTMMPAGPFDGLGGQHGFARWADYEVTTEDAAITLVAQVPEDSLQLTKEIRLNPANTSELTLITKVENPGSETVHTSIGEHLYFMLPKEDADGLRFGFSPASMSAIPGIEGIMQGEAVFVDAFDGDMLAEFPDGKRINLRTTALISSQDDTESLPHVPMGMLLWHRPGTESICLEPVVGSKSLSDNARLAIESGDTVIVQTTIRLL